MEIFKPVNGSIEVNRLKKLIQGDGTNSGCCSHQRSVLPLSDLAVIANSTDALLSASFKGNWPYNGAKFQKDYPNDRYLLDLTLDWVSSKHHKKLLVHNHAER